MVAAFVISLCALVVAVMTLPTVFQMLWGKPRIKYRFGKTDDKDGMVLSCELINKPITNHILKILGVRRVPVMVMVSFQIFEEGTKKPVYTGVIPHIVTHSGAIAQRVMLNSSIAPITVPIILVRKKDGKVFQSEDELREALPTGSYYVKLTLTEDGDTRITHRRFDVSDRYPYAYWCPN